MNAPLSSTFRHCLCLCAALSLPVLTGACTDSSNAEPPMPPLPRNVAQAIENAAAKPPPPPLLAEPTPPAPKTVDPSAALARIVGQNLLPGDQIIAELLAIEMQGAQKPVYKSTVDYPFSDGAAQAISEEVRLWIRHKLALMGYAETQGKPTLSWVIHVEPEAEGQYRLETSLQSQGNVRFKKNFIVPAQFSGTRMNQVFGEDFAAVEQ